MNHQQVKEQYEQYSKDFKKVFDFDSAKQKPELSSDFSKDIEMLAHKFKQLNYGFERDYEKDQYGDGTTIERKKNVPEGNIKRIP